MNTYKIPWFCVIQPYLPESTRPIPSPYIIPIMKSPVKLMVFLLYLELFNKADDPRIIFAYLFPIVEVKGIFLSYQEQLMVFFKIVFSVLSTLIQDKTITYVHIQLT